MIKLTEAGRLARNKYYRDYHRAHKERMEESKIKTWNKKGEELAAEEK